MKPGPNLYVIGSFPRQLAGTSSPVILLQEIHKAIYDQEYHME